MLKQQAYIFRRVAISLNCIILVGSFLIAYFLCTIWGHVTQLNDYVWLLFFALPTWLVISNHFKIYASLRMSSNSAIVWVVFKTHVLGGVFLAATVYLIAPHDYSRMLFLTFLALSFLMMSLNKIVIKTFLHVIRRKGLNFRNILIVGTGQNALKICDTINSQIHWGLHLVGLI